MNLEQQVCSLKPSQRLKELGVKQESVWIWYTVDAPSVIPPQLDLSSKDYAEVPIGQIYAAFTVAELGEMLPQIEIKKQWWVPVSYQFAGTSGYRCDLVDRKMLELGYGVMGLTEADARAKMLIYLIENKLIEAHGIISPKDGAKPRKVL